MTDSPDPPETPPRLWHFRVSHYNEKVRWALDHKRWPHVRTTLVPAFHLVTARRLSGQSKLPILKLGGRVLSDSSAILAELERLRPEPALFPRDPEQRALALAIEDHFDEQVAPDLRRLFWSTYLGHPDLAARLAADGASAFTRRLWRVLFPALRPALSRNMGIDRQRLSDSRARLNAHFEFLERGIGPSGFLVGDAFTVADLTAAAVMTAILRPPEFSYPLPEPWPEELVELRASVNDRSGARWVAEIYQRHRGRSYEIVSVAP
jgi:glutathione S-transferase